MAKMLASSIKTSSTLFAGMSASHLNTLLSAELPGTSCASFALSHKTPPALAQLPTLPYFLNLTGRYSLFV